MEVEFTTCLVEVEDHHCLVEVEDHHLFEVCRVLQPLLACCAAYLPRLGRLGANESDAGARWSQGWNTPTNSQQSDMFLLGNSLAMPKHMLPRKGFIYIYIYTPVHPVRGNHEIPFGMTK